MRPLTLFSLFISGSVLAGCMGMPEPDGTEARLLAEAAGKPVLSPVGREGQTAIASAGLISSPAVREAASMVAVSADEVRVQRASLFPALGFEFGVGTGKAGRGDPALEIDGRQLLTDFGQTDRQITVADLDLQINYLTFHKRINDVLRETLTASEELQLYRKLSGIYASQVQEMKTIEQRLTPKTGGKIDLMEAQRRVQAAEFLHYNNGLELGEAEERMLRLTRQSHAIALDVNAASCTAQGRSLELQTAILREARTKIGLETAEAARNPRLTLNPIAKTGGGAMKLGLNLGVESDLLHGGGLTAKVNAAQNAKIGASAAVEQAQLEDMLTERRLARDLMGGQQKIAMLDRQIALLEQTRAQYRQNHGAGRMTDLLDNSEEYYSRLAEREQTRADLAKARLDCAIRSRTLRQQLQLEGNVLYGLPLARPL